MERHHHSLSPQPRKTIITTTATATTTIDSNDKQPRSIMSFLSQLGCMNSTRVMVLLVLCLQNSMFTVLRRYSLGILKETYSKHECLLVQELIKIVFSAWMVKSLLPPKEGGGSSSSTTTFQARLVYLVQTSSKMFVLALIYGSMNILSFVSLRNIGAGMFTIFAQCKILTTATFSTIILRRQYSSVQWRALMALMLGVLLFSEPIWGDPKSFQPTTDGANQILGTAAVLIEVTLSGFASIYFEKVIKTDPLQLNIWERNFQLALGSIPVYLVFIAVDGGGKAGIAGGWSWVAVIVASLGAAGGLLVALSIKYGDSILKTLATTGAIVLSALLDHWFLAGPLTAVMMIAGVQVIIAICDYTFDPTPPASSSTSTITTPPMEAISKCPSETESVYSKDDVESTSLLMARAESGGVVDGVEITEVVPRNVKE